MKKMKCRMGLALIVMLTIEVGRIRKKEEHLMRILVKVAQGAEKKNRS